MDFVVNTEFNVKLLEVQNAPKSQFIPETCDENTPTKFKWACDLGTKISNDVVNVAFELASKQRQHSNGEVQLPKTSHLKQILYDKTTFEKLLSNLP